MVCFAHLTNSIRRTRGPPPYLSLSLPSSLPACPSRTLKISQQEAFSVVMPIYLETRAFISTHLIGSRVYLLPSHRPPSHSLCLHCVGVFVRFLLAAFLLLLIFQQVTCTQNKIKAGQRQRQVTNGGAGAGEGEREQAPPTTEQHQRNAKGHLNMEKLKQNVERRKAGECAGGKS